MIRSAATNESKHKKLWEILLEKLQFQIISLSSVLYLFFLSLGLFWRIWHMDLVQSAVLYAVMTLVSTYLVAFAYKNVKFVLKHK